MEPVRMSTDFQLNHKIGKRQIRSTAGAISLKTDKGDYIVEKVKVTRYIAGKRPTYAPHDVSDEDSFDEDEEIEDGSPVVVHAEDIAEPEEEEAADHGHRRRERPTDGMDDQDMDQDESGDDLDEMTEDVPMARRRQAMEESSDDEELDEEALERRRELLRRKALERAQEQDVLDIEDDDVDGRAEEQDDEIESSEYEEYSDSDEEAGARLKPVFVRKTDRVTIEKRNKAQDEDERNEEKQRRVMEERKRQSAMLVNEILRGELKEEQGVEKEEEVVLTDDDNGEEEYEAWKVRELKRIKRDKDEKETREKERLESERIHGMTEEERRLEFRMRPKEVTNKATKGKYKFLQKYFHRGAFFMSQEDGLMRQDFAQPTLEDHFDKTILPKVMQVKNFGRSGRTKYTHLVDQDTTNTDAAWFADNAQNLKFHTVHGGGMKQAFDRPTKKRK